MNTTIRELQKGDYPHIEAMDTGIENDYVIRIAEKLMQGDNRLFGLFIDGQLVSIGGYSVFTNRYAMLGRLRSDRRFKKNGYATELMSHMMNTAFQQEGIQWVGANTQEENLSARRVMEKIGLSQYIMLHGALTKDTSALETGAAPWTPITDLQRKKDWVQQAYIKSALVFPYECYYLFPSTADLFQPHDLEKWTFHENDAKTRFFITKTDQKKHHYLHAIYPWSDITSQKGLWETISNDYQKLKKQTGEETYIWMDLSKEEASSLPSNHQFELPSPWILYGMDKTEWETSKL